MRNLLIILLVIFFDGCFPDMEPPKHVLKSIRINKNEIEWFSFSSAYAETPDVITITDGSHIDTICKSTNIRDIKDLQHNNLLIYFLGSPKRYEEKIQLANQVLGITIRIDSNSRVQSTGITK